MIPCRSSHFLNQRALYQLSNARYSNRSPLRKMCASRPARVPAWSDRTPAPRVWGATGGSSPGSASPPCTRRARRYGSRRRGASGCASTSSRPRPAASQRASRQPRRPDTDTRAPHAADPADQTQDQLLGRSGQHPQEAVQRIVRSGRQYRCHAHHLTVHLPFVFSTASANRQGHRAPAAPPTWLMIWRYPSTTTSANVSKPSSRLVAASHVTARS